MSHAHAVPFGFRNFSILFGLALTFQGVRAQPQIPLRVNPCDLVAHAEDYSGKTVKVRSRVSIGFENFTLATSGCDANGREIWLIYGGDEPTPTMSTVNDQSRSAGAVLKVQGRPVVLHRDAELELFKRRLSAQRLTGVSDAECEGSCRFYDVTATITGIFFASTNRPLGGFGHMGCCNLLAIEQIEDVDAKRTDVPAGGRFSCTTETWEVPTVEIKSLERRECKGIGDCRSAALDEIKGVASHWNDSLPEVAEGDLEAYFGPSWRSSDLLKTYDVDTQSSDGKHQSPSVTRMSAHRTVCTVVVPPLPMSTPIGCRNLWSEFSTGKDKIKQIQESVEPGREGWRVGSPEVAARPALEEASVIWGVTPARGLTLSACSNPMTVEGDQFSWCNWIDPDGMQELSVQVTRFGSQRRAKKWDDVPWILSRGHGLVCAAEE